MTSAPGAKWYDSLPAPISTPAQMSADDLHKLFQPSQSESTVLVVDVRRADIEVCIARLRGRHRLTGQGRSSMYDPKRHQSPSSDIPPDPTEPHLYIEPVRLNIPKELMIDTATLYSTALAPMDVGRGVQLGMRMHYLIKV